MPYVIAFMVCLGGAAMNVGFFVADTSRSLNLASAIFCGGLAVFNAVMAARRS